MTKTRQAGQFSWRRRLMVGAFSVALTLTVGCSQTPTVATQPLDPLNGDRTPPGAPPTVGAPKTTQATPAVNPAYQNGLAPIGPNDLSAANNATLASMSGGNPLGRPQPDGPYRAPAQFTSTPRDPAPSTGYPAPNPNPKVEPIPDAKPSPTGWQAHSTDAAVQPVSTSNAAPTTDVLKKQLDDRGVINQKIDQLPQGIHLTCYLPGPNGVRQLEVTAADYATAVQAILQQLDTPAVR